MWLRIIVFGLTLQGPRRLAMPMETALVKIMILTVTATVALPMQ